MSILFYGKALFSDDILTVVPPNSERPEHHLSGGNRQCHFSILLPKRRN